MRVKFTVIGNPQGKLRPRFRRQGKFVQTYTDANTAEYENLIMQEYIWQSNKEFPANVPLEMRIKAYYPIPVSISKKKQAAMEAGEIRPTIKPDSDNVMKVFADALQGIAFKDDKNIVLCQIEKHYSRVPRVEVEISDEIA